LPLERGLRQRGGEKEENGRKISRGWGKMEDEEHWRHKTLRQSGQEVKRTWCMQSCL